MDGPSGIANHHGTWNTGWTSSNESAATNDNIFGFGSDRPTYLIHDATVDSVNGLTFNVEAGQVYTIAVGGHEFGSVFGPTADYKLTVNAVPVPAAVWLFGSALAGLLGFNRRRDKIAA